MSILRRGSRGPEVTALQQKLNQLGYHLDTDGIFGSGVEWAVKDFQRKQNLDDDGLVGPGTLSAIDRAAAAPTSQTLRKGNTGEAVQELQRLLIAAGYDIGTDGVFGWGTDAAVKAFQQSKGLTVDGLVGRGTMNALKLASAPPPAPSPAPAPSTTPAGSSGGSKLLTNQDIVNVATMLGVEPAAIKAVYTVESSGKGFLSNGDPKILFEGHIFWRQLKNRGIDPEQYAAANPDILYPKWTRGHYKGGIGEYDRLGRAKLINEEAALASASWGTFQIMGFNYKACGFGSVSDYVKAMYVSEGEHLKAFGNFIKSVRLLPHLKTKDWAAFAKGYNGPAYAQNQYDTKLAAAYQKALSEG